MIALVTGASSGIGRAIAIALAREGAAVALLGRRGEALAAVAAQVRADGGRALACRADLAVDDDIHAAAETVLRALGPLDALVHGAAEIALGRHGAAPVAALDRQYRANVRGPWLLTQALLPALRARKGQVVFLNSSAGMRAKAGAGQYAATKFALRAVADALREEESGAGIRVLTVFLGRTATPMQEALHREAGRDYRAERLIQPESVGHLVSRMLSLPRDLEATDVHVRPILP